MYKFVELNDQNIVTNIGNSLKKFSRKNVIDGEDYPNVRLGQQRTDNGFIDVVDDENADATTEPNNNQEG